MSSIRVAKIILVSCFLFVLICKHISIFTDKHSLQNDVLRKSHLMRILNRKKRRNPALSLWVIPLELPHPRADLFHCNRDNDMSPSV